MKKCLNCDAKVLENKYASRKKFCSKRCGRQYHYNKNRDKERQQCKEWYKNNRESEIKKNKEYRKQNKELFKWYHNKERFNGMREYILKRDDLKCRVCHNSDYDYLAVHHIDGNNHYKETTNNDITNLITLCKSCHNKLHRWQDKNQVLKTDEDIVRTIRRLIEVGSKSLR